MVFSRGLVISLGVSALSATLLFLYFRNRITSVERKVDVMFDLIQSHENDRQQMVQRQMMMSQQSAPSSQNTGAWAGEDNQPERNLIDVSEDEDEEYESDDSREVSDNEDEDLEERIKLVTNDIDLEEVDEKENVVVLETDNTEPVTVDETVELEEVDIENETVSQDDNKTTVEAVAATNESDEADEADDSLEDSDSEEEDEQQVETEAEPEVEYNKLKVSELKAIAEAKGLTNYKSLKKQPLIDLIKATE